MDSLLESFAVGTALTGLLITLLAEFPHLVSNSARPVGGASIGIAIFYPHYGLSLLIWLLKPWSVAHQSTGRKVTVASIAILSAVLSLTVGGPE